MRTSVRNEAAISFYNQLRNVENLRADFVEYTLALIEDRAAPIVARPVEGDGLDAAERLDIALFLYVQHHRTPRGRQWFVHGLEQSHRLELMRRVLDAKQVQESLSIGGEGISLSEAEARGRRLAKELEDGQLEVKVQHDHAVADMFMFVEDVVPHIAGEMAWTVVHTEAREGFIISGHLVLIPRSDRGSQEGRELAVVARGADAPRWTRRAQQSACLGRAGTIQGR